MSMDAGFRTGKCTDHRQASFVKRLSCKQRVYNELNGYFLKLKTLTIQITRSSVIRFIARDERRFTNDEGRRESWS